MTNYIRRAFHIHVHDRSKLASADFPERGVLVDDAGIIQQQIRRTVSVEQQTGPRLYFVVRGNIHDVKIMRLAKALAELVDFMFRTAAAQNGMTQPDQFFGHRASQPARDSRDED